MGFISHHITPLVITSLGGQIHTHANTYTYTYTHIYTYRHSHGNNFKKPGVCRSVAGAPGLTIFQSISLSWYSLDSNFSSSCIGKS